MSQAIYQLPPALPSSAPFQVNGFDNLISSLKRLQNDAENMAASTEQRHFVDNVQIILEQGGNIKSQLVAIALQLSRCNEGAVSAAHLLESADNLLIHAGGLHCLLAPLVQRQQDAVSHLTEML